MEMNDHWSFLDKKIWINLVSFYVSKNKEDLELGIFSDLHNLFDNTDIVNKLNVMDIEVSFRYEFQTGIEIRPISRY